MKFKDPVKWTDTEIELQADEASRAFLRFFIEWFTSAEEGYRERPLSDAVRSAFRTTELHLGFVSVEWIGQMLLLAREHWTHSELLLEGLTVLETRMLEQMEAVKLVELQESARMSG